MSVVGCRRSRSGISCLTCSRSRAGVGRRARARVREDRINRLLVPAFGNKLVSAVSRDELQDFLDKTAKDGSAQSIVSHLRWDLRMIFAFSVNEGLRATNPAELLYVPKAPSRERHVLSLDQARVLFAAYDVRERLVLKLCGLLGLRPGEALALQWQDVLPEGLHVRRRVYRGKVDTPKSTKSTRIAALSKTVREDVEAWRKTSPRTKPSDWVFASESGETPVCPTNVWYDKIRPKLEGLGCRG